ncbi:hypothetical protein M2480_000791 [Parabacteroides sp. PFB2-12]|uniref:DUF4943 family protein n=1 Tax=unclassified Parabacteroides TaxID=2649774 RepID=UPI002473D0B2|nr:MULTISPECIES: DUF4943 family protein [unclassified Parabacteroides]MDH6341752.1 hypothetical protein [Parabacteroides sp. PM6-13]MDH6389825.1 hypothetical protein [Parabacteroides sp. PFB2-12]
MKRIYALLFVWVLCVSCDYSFDLNDPDVREFVFRLKNGTYECYLTSSSGERMGLQMPVFQMKDIPELLEYAADTTHIEDFPINSSSRVSASHLEDGTYILGECLLWIVEGIRLNKVYPSEQPVLIEKTPSGSHCLTGQEVLEVWELYNQWWVKNQQGDWPDIDPLEGSGYLWW